jgi:hypothetical protein
MNACPHDHTDKRRLVTSNGTVQIKVQCLDCWTAISNPLRREDNPGWESFPEFDEAKREGGWVARSAELRAMKAAADIAWREEYEAHLNSTEWKTMRLRLFVDRRGICDGCGRNLMAGTAVFPPFFEAHHIAEQGAYKVGFGNELLFQLALLCQPCHRQIPSKLRDEMGR